MERATIKRLAAEEMENRSSHAWKERINKYYHGERVAKLALTLRKLVIPNDASRDQILTAAAWFHDIDRSPAHDGYTAWVRLLQDGQAVTSSQSAAR